MSSEVERKIDEVLSRLEAIEKLLTLGEARPERDELEVIEEYLKEKEKGETERIPLEAALNEL